jgi:hypothetical protein
MTTQTTPNIAPLAGPAVGEIPPIECAPWCKYGDGHTEQLMREDQTCWGPDHYVEASTEELHAEYSSRTGERVVWPTRVGACAYRAFNEHPTVYLHVEVPTRGVDTSIKLTAAEAWELADYLVEVAELIGGTESP